MLFEWDDLEGEVILDIEITPEAVTIRTYEWPNGIVFEAEGDCCARAYISDFDESVIPLLIDEQIRKAEVVSVIQNQSSSLRGINHDIDFYKIMTNRADLTITLHTEHNGHYNGRLVCTSHTY